MLERGKKMPYYDIDTFIESCDPEGSCKVVFLGKVLETAARDFNLQTIEEIKGFIFQGGIDEEREFKGTDEWMNNPDKEHPIKVDGYEFYTLCKRGYIAFMKSHTGLWLVKSLHISDKAVSSFLIAFDKAGINPKGINES